MRQKVVPGPKSLAAPGQAANTEACVLSVYFLRSPNQAPWVFVDLKVTEPSPFQDSCSVRQKGGLPGPPPVVPDPESIDAQASYRHGRRSSSTASLCTLASPFREDAAKFSQYATVTAEWKRLFRCL